MVKLYTVSLSEAERLLLIEAARHPRASNRFTTRARILLVVDQGEDGPGWTDTVIEDVLDVYTRPYDPKRPQVCFDELPKQLVTDTREPLPASPGQPRREDYEYERHGTANLFLWYEPLAGRRHVEVTERRTMVDWAHCIKDMVDIHYPDAEKIVLVMDNLNIHSPASLYASFPPAEGKRLADKLEIHWTPKHGSRLNAAEIELAILSAQCLDRRIPDQDTLRHEVTAWEESRNALGAAAEWRFTTEDARTKLRHLYPTHDG